MAESAEAEEAEESNIEDGENAGADEIGAAGQAKTAGTTSANAPDTSETSGLSAEVLRQLNALRTSLIREINRQINGIIHGVGIDTPRRSTPVVRENPGQAAASGETASITLYGDISILRDKTHARQIRQ